MDYYPIIAERFQATLERVAMSVDPLAPAIGQAADMLTHALLMDRKIMVCAAGIDAPLAQLFTAALVGHLDEERPALPVIDLGGAGCVAPVSDDYQSLFARQVQALGQSGDTLLLISGAAAEPTLAAALQAALQRDIDVVALLASTDRTLSETMPANAAVIRTEATLRSGTLELHTLILLALCQLIDIGLFGPRE